MRRDEGGEFFGETQTQSHIHFFFGVGPNLNESVASRLNPSLLHVHTYSINIPNCEVSSSSNSTTITKNPQNTVSLSTQTI